MTALRIVAPAPPQAFASPGPVPRALAGIDLSGFTPWVAAHSDPAGLEAIADSTDSLLDAIAAALRGHGYEPAFATGDGLVAVAASPAPDPEGAARTVCALEPAARMAFATGPIARATLPGLRGRVFELWHGDGVSALHAELARIPRARALSRPPRAAPAPAKLRAATLAPETVGCLCAPVAALDAIATLLPGWQAEAEAGGGDIAAIAHDDSGLLLRFNWPAAAAPAARAFLATAAAALAAAGHAAGTGVATGLVFRSRAGVPAHAAAIAQGPAINAAAKAAKRGATAPAEPLAVPPRPTPELIGRETELARLEAMLTDGTHRPAHLRGDPGMGKSALLAALAARAPAILVTARPSACLDPLGLWALALDAAQGPGAYARLATAIDARLHDAPPAARLAARADALLDALAGRRLLFDDVQWADADTWRLAARAPDARIALLLSGRPEAPAPADRTLHLAPLAPHAVEALMRATGGNPAHAALAGGNPLHAVQLAFSAAASASLDAVLDARVAALDGDARAAMRLLAVAGRPVPDAAWNQLAARLGVATGEADPRPWLERFAYLHRTPSGTAPAHRLLAERVAAQTPPSVRRALHWAAATARFPDARPGEAAAHWSAAGAPARAAIAYARDAETALAAGGHDAAARLFAEALAAHARLPDAPARRAALGGGLGFALWATGDARGANAAARTARAAADRALGGRHGEAHGRRRRLRAAFFRHPLPRRLREAMRRVAVLESELGYFRGDLRAFAAGSFVALGLGGDPRGAALIRARGAASLSVILGILGLSGLAVRVGAAARRSGDPLVTATVDAGEAIWRAARAHWPQAVAALDRADAAAATDPQLRLAALCLRALIAQMRGELARADTLWARLEADARAAGHAQATAWALYGAATPRIARNEGAEALATIAAAKAALAGNEDRLSDLNCAALESRAALAASDTPRAIAAAIAATALAARLQPLNFGSLEGFTAPALALAETLATAPGPQARAAFPAALRQARRFAFRFPIGAPRARLAAALAARDAPAAEAAARRAEKLGMHADAALARRWAKELACPPT